MLTDYQSLAGGNIDFSVKDPSRDDEALTESMSVGVEKVQFNVVSNEEFQVKNGYLGLVVSYGGEHETIPFVSNTSDLEYQVTSFIHKLTVKDKKQIGFLRSFGAKDISQMQGINGELEKQFKITTVTAKPKEDPAKEKEELPEGQEEAEEEKEYTLEIEADIDLLVISGNEEKISGQPLEEIKKFMENGGSVIFLVDTVNINDQSFTAMANENSLAGFIDEELGVKVKDNLVYDLRSNQTVSFSGGAMNYLLPYPFWTEVVPQKEKFPAFSDLETVGLTWASTISFDEGKANDKGYEVLEILRTTKFAGTKSNTASILPNSEFSKESLEEKLVGVALKNSDTGSRVIVVGDSDFVTDRFSRNRPQNIVFMTSLSSWLTQAQSLTDIQSKARVERKLKFERDGQMAMIKFGNMAFALLVPLTIGGWRIMRRKKLQTREYE